MTTDEIQVLAQLIAQASPRRRAIAILALTEAFAEIDSARFTKIVFHCSPDDVVLEVPQPSKKRLRRL